MKKNKEIVITTDGYETMALLFDGKKFVKKATARCNPSDTFDFSVGAMLALERLMAKELKIEIGKKYRLKPFEAFANHQGIPKNIWDELAVCCTVYGRCGIKSYLVESEHDSLHLHWAVLQEAFECEVEDKKPSFVPHLEKNNGKHYGNIGEPTKYKDAIGRPLCVGDVVDIYDDDLKLIHDAFIVKAELSYRNDQAKAYVMGIESSCNDETGEINMWKIIKKIPFKDIKHGEEHGSDFARLSV